MLELLDQRRERLLELASLEKEEEQLLLGRERVERRSKLGLLLLEEEERDWESSRGG